ncbi:hypothetical protein PBI_ARCHERS7_233 [Mycobacterium phage ArcherS7]|uniref:Uncharacterized protein n=19 Tax=Bixzunavirus TaxID=680114 RepID=R4TAG3_9CAUD|nr:hypothetical protein M181_gp125 [Mycobacterium phage Gizmo]YP_008061460.1 hypothetical protein M180_gp120 [Mycobacterium phage ArcherS7]YP_008061690.1 hypothetical protein M182_gp120 [Mycobacterium phage Astraea]YP_009014788.1 hypothetical protein LINSTU_230 [Mycobacterium phage LinStu]YP_009017974.1 hypothetical protein PLEIONE_236 [Mycobacterium phage Pleione]YP_009221329.1 hypothetical protein AWH68_gp121 [Mycobacterium phage Breeniome]YP_010057151.1 hypothetical protein KHO58_gp123 [My
MVERLNAGGHHHVCLPTLSHEPNAGETEAEGSSVINCHLKMSAAITMSPSLSMFTTE